MEIIQRLGLMMMASIFIMSGVDKFQNPAQTATFMASRYEDVFNYTANRTDLTHIPHQLKPTFIQEHADQIVLGAAGLEILGGILVILNLSLGGFILGTFLLATIAIIHNPIVFNKTHEYIILNDFTREQLGETIQALKNLCILGGLMLVGYKNKKIIPVVTKKTPKAQDQQPLQKAQAKKPKVN